jgi:hypothetical protein
MLNGRTRRLRETNCPNHVVGQAGGDIASETKRRWSCQNMTTEPIRPTAKCPSFDFKSPRGRSRRHRLALRPVLTRGSHATTPELNLPMRGTENTAQGRGRRTRLRAAVSVVFPNGRLDDRPDRSSAREPRRGSPVCRNGYSREPRTPGSRWKTGRPFLR